MSLHNERSGTDPSEVPVNHVTHQLAQAIIRLANARGLVLRTADEIARPERLQKLPLPASDAKGDRHDSKPVRNFGGRGSL